MKNCLRSSENSCVLSYSCKDSISSAWYGSLDIFIIFIMQDSNTCEIGQKEVNRMFANKVSDVAMVVEAKDEAMAMVVWVEQQEELLL
jgi:hypothetical protein